MNVIVLLFYKQKTAYEMRISDWSSDVCSSDLCSYSWVLSGSERWIGELVDAVLVTAAAKTRVDECGDAGLGHFHADQPRPPGDDIGVIMFARQHGRPRLERTSVVEGRSVSVRVDLGGRGHL